MFNSDENPTMIAANTFNSIVQQIQASNLNFQIMLSPFTVNISVKKTPTIDKSGIPLLVRTSIRPKDDSVDEMAALKEKNLKLENELVQIKHEYEY